MLQKEETTANYDEDLSAEENEILAMMLKGEIAGEMKPGSIPVRKIRSPVPLSYSQRRLWVLDRLVPGNPFYNLPTAVQLEGEIDIEVYERGLNELVRRHETLRTVFTMENEEPLQVILPGLEIKVDIIDLQEIPAARREGETARRIAEEAGKPFDLEHGPLLRAKLLRLGNRRNVLLYTMHHIISDTWSMELFNKELFLVYTALLKGETPALPALPIQYADFAVWQRERLPGGIMERQLSYWREMLRGEIPILELPTDRQRPAISTYRGKIQYFTIAENPTEKIIQLNYSEKCSMFMTLLAAFNVLLYRYSGQDDILVGSPISNRNHAELEKIIGFFVNTLVLRTDLAGNPTFRQLLARVKETASAAYDNQEIPFEKLVEELQPDRYMSHTPLFQVMFVLQNVPKQKLTPSTAKPDFAAANLPVHTGTSKFDIWLSLTQYEKNLGAVIEYSTDIFDDRTITRYCRHFEMLLTGIGEDPDRKINDLPLLLPAEKQQLLTEWNNTGRDYTLRGLPDMFAGQVERTPAQIAVTGQRAGKEEACNAGNLSYKELKTRAGAIARLLRAQGGQGLADDGIVGIMAERSLEMVAGILGILEAGGAYLPLDPENPPDRIDYMLADSGVKIVLSDRQEVGTGQRPVLVLDLNNLGDRLEIGNQSGNDVGNRLACSEELAVRNLGDRPGNLGDRPGIVGNLGDRLEIENQSEELAARNPRPAANPFNLAYIIYTSGSTGKPKGVMSPQAGICNRLLWMQETYRLTAEDRVLQKTPFSFDVSVWEFFLPLLNGAVLVMAEPGGHRDTAYLAEAIIKEKITTIHFVPSMLNVFLEEPGVTRIRSLKRVICSGEALPFEYTERFFKVFERETGVELHNLYGPTEASVDVTSWACDRGMSRGVIPLGRPIANTQIYILDRDSTLVPVGVPGELHIAGIQLARGYLNRPELTGERFLATEDTEVTEGHNKKFLRGVEGGSFFKKRPPSRRRLYKTGDLARWQPDGAIEFLGRLDFQVKVRGFRIELGEIETLLREHEALHDAVVLAIEGAPGAAGKKLAAYIVPKQQPGQSSQTETSHPLIAEIPVELPAKIRGFLKERLPEYMMPSYFIPLKHLPLTANGKLDRKALPTHEQGWAIDDRQNRETTPRNPGEALFARLWKEVLLIEDIGMTDNFFQLGGDSINAIQVIARANKTGLNLSVRDLYRNMSIAELAAYADRHSARPPLSPAEPAKETMPAVDKQTIMRHLPPGTEIDDIYPVTPFQKHMLRYYRDNRHKSPDGPGLFVNQVIYRMPLASAEIQIIRDVFQQMTDVYPYLRTAFLWENMTEPIQVIHKNVKVQFENIDCGHIPAGERSRREAEILELDRYRGFERDKPNVYRMTVLYFAEGDVILVHTSDLMRVDGWSAMIVYIKFKESLQALRTGQETEFKAGPDYKDYLTWLSRQDDAGGEEFWKQSIQGCKLPTPLLADAPKNRPEHRDAKGFTYRGAPFNLEQTIGIEDFSKQYQVALSALGCAIWALILNRYTAERSVIFGVLLSGRGNALAMVENMIGQSMNVLPVRMDIDYDKPILEWLNDTWETLLALNEYECNQIDKIREWWNIDPAIPLFESYLVIENFPGIDKRRTPDMLELGEAALSLGFDYTAQMEYPLRVELQPGPILGFAMQYYRNCFTDEAIKTMLDNFHCLCAEILKNPHQTTGELIQSLNR